MEPLNALFLDYKQVVPLELLYLLAIGLHRSPLFIASIRFQNGSGGAS